MLNSKILFYFLFLLSLNVFAQIQKKIPFPLYGEAIVDAPLFIGAGGGYSINDHFQADLVYGIMPQPFSTLIGQVAASSGGNDNYQNLIEDALESNSLFRLSGTYNLDNRATGWHFTLAGALMNSSGDADANEISRAFGGQDYSTLLALLIASGRSTNVHMDSTLKIFEAQVSYSWLLHEHFVIDLGGGFLKVFSSDVTLHTGLTSYENTQQGRELIRSSENSIESMIEEYGISPTASVQVKYIF